MSRYIGPVLGLTLLGVIVGFILGLVIGYLFPVTFINTDASTLQTKYKEDYVFMVSTAFALDGSLADAKLRLSKIEPNAANATKLVTTKAEQAIEQNDARNARNLAVLAVALGANSPTIRSYMATIATATPTTVPTLAPTTTRTPTPVALLVETATPTPQPTATRLAAPQSTNTPIPTLTNAPVPQLPTATATRRPPTNTPPPPPPTETPKPSIDFKVIEQRLQSIQENGGCQGRHNYYITVIDKNGNPLNGIVVRRIYAGNVDIPYTGKEKGPGKTETETPRYSGDSLYVLGDTSGARFTSEQTHNLSVSEAEIPIPDLITAGYCPNTAECQQRIKDNQLCLGHHSYSITFQRQW